jgi:cytochrome P450
MCPGISQQIDVIKSSGSVSKSIDSPETIFHGLLESSLPLSERSTERLTEEALTIIGAGTVTTAHTLAVIFYHLLSNPDTLAQLRKELEVVYHHDNTPTWNQLSHLPYLSAIISEGLRLSFGVSHRLQRISPDTPLQYKAYTIAPGTPISQTQMFILTDPSIFPSPNQFLPDRWLEPSDRTQPDTKASYPDPVEAKKYLVPFSRGSRSCLGINLAYAELFLTVAMLLRPIKEGGLDLRLFETGPEEMVIEHDFFNPSPKLGAQGVRVVVM